MTDQLIRQALSELAAGPEAGRLVDDVLRAVDVTPQGRASWLGFGGRRTAVLLIAVILLLGALAGALTLASRPQPLPPQTERTINFSRPFEYVRPAGLGLVLTTGLDGLGLNDAYALEAMRRLYAPCPDGCSVGASDTPLPLTEAEELEYARHVYDWNVELSKLMTSFTVGGPEGDRGVIVALPGEAPFGSAVWCYGTDDRWSNPPTADEILITYRAWTEDLVVPAPSPTTFDGYPAASLRTPAGRCPTRHVTERTRVEPGPGMLTFVQVEGSTVAVVIWGATDALLDGWLPTATEFVKTIHFVPEEST